MDVTASLLVFDHSGAAETWGREEPLFPLRDLYIRAIKTSPGGLPTYLPFLTTPHRHEGGCIHFFLR